MHVCMYVCKLVRMYVHMHVCMYECVCTYIRMYVCTCVCMYICTWVCIFLIYLFTACSITYCNTTCLRDHIHVYNITFLLIVHLVPYCSSFIRLIWSCSEMIVLLYGTNLWCYNILLFLVVTNTDYAQIGLLQFFIFYGVCKMEFFTKLISVMPCVGLIHVYSMFHFSLSSAIVFFLISSMRWFRFFMFLKDSRVILLSVCIIIVLGGYCLWFWSL